MTVTKEEALKGLEEAYETLEKLYDENLDKMTVLQSQIEAIKDNNVNYHMKMKQLSLKIIELRGK